MSIIGGEVETFNYLQNILLCETLLERPISQWTVVTVLYSALTHISITNTGKIQIFVIKVPM